MKKLLIGILIFSFNASCFSKTDESNGFRQIKWQSSISIYENVMHLTSEQGSEKKFYTIDNDEMSLGKASLSSIVYIFYKGKFSAVSVQTDSSAKNVKQVLVELKKVFGKPLYANKYINKYRWKNKNTIVSLKCYSSSHKCSIKYKSTKMNKLEKNNKN